MLNKLNPKGFAILETLLILIIVTIIGGVGYFVYKAQTKASDTISQASLSSQSPAVNKKNYLVIREWNVKLDVGSVSDSSYTLVGTNKAFLSTNKMKKDNKCSTYYTADFPSFFFVVRAKPADTPVFGDAPAGTVTKTVADYAKQTPSVVKLGDYFYYTVHGNGMSCGNADENALDRIVGLRPKIISVK